MSLEPRTRRAPELSGARDRAAQATERLEARRGPELAHGQAHSFASAPEPAPTLSADGGEPPTRCRNERHDVPPTCRKPGRAPAAEARRSATTPDSLPEQGPLPRTTIEGGRSRDAVKVARLSPRRLAETSVSSRWEGSRLSSGGVEMASGTLSAASEAKTTLGTRALGLGRMAAGHAAIRVESALVDATGYTASGGGDAPGLGDSVASGTRSAARTLATSIRMRRGRVATVASVAAELSDSDEARGADRAAHAAREAKRAASVLRGRPVRAAGGARAHLGARTRAKRLTYAIQASRARSEVAVGQGVLARAATTARAVASAATAAFSSVGGSVAAAVSSALPALSALIVPLALVALIAAVVSVLGSQEKVEGLGTYSTQMVQYLRDYGWDDTHVAAAVANAIYESGGDQAALEIDPSHEGDLSGEVNYEYEKNCGIYSWTDTAPGTGVMTELKGFAASRGKEWQDLTCQLDFFTQQYLATRRRATDRWLAIDDLHEATKVMVAPTGGILAGAQLAVESPAIDVRYDLADRVYAALTSGGAAGGQEYEDASADQRAVADATWTTPSLGPGLCAGWVTQVFQNAGMSAPYGDARDMYAAYCTSSDPSELKVGMLVAVPTVTNGTAASKVYGHVGIYVGGGIVRHSTSGQVFSTPLSEWLKTFASESPAMWGFPPGLGQ